MKVSPHTHAESHLTGSTLAALVKRAKDLGRTHFAYTDHGHLSSAIKAYKEATSQKLKFIPGVEIYFKDAECPIITGTEADRCRYFTLTLHAQDQTAFQEINRIVSEPLPTILMYEKDQQIWNWPLLERLSKFNVTATLGGVHCMVAKPMLAGRADLGELVMKKLQGLFGNRLYSAMLVEPWTKKYSQVVEIKYTDGTKDSMLAADRVSTDRARNIKASDLLGNSRHSDILSRRAGTMAYTVNKKIASTKLHKGFLPLPGGDASLKANYFLKALSNKHGVTITVTDYAYYAHKEDKIVQTMLLQGENKLQPTLHMKSEVEVTTYLSDVLKMNPTEINTVIANTDAWADTFNNLTLKYDWRLATVEGDPLVKAMEIIKANGRMKWDDPVYVNRLREELNVIAKNGKKDLTPYFLPIRDVLDNEIQNDQLTGPGRGSAGGSLFVYCLGITQINPFKFDLPFNRFFSMDRINAGELPDIDVDLENRDILVGKDGKSGYLYGRWGNKAAQISTRTTMRLKSAILEANRYIKGAIEPEVQTLSKGLPPPPQGVSDQRFVFGYEDKETGAHVPGLIETSLDLKKFSETHPLEWEIVEKAMGITSAMSRHASAFVLSDIPIQDVVPVKDGNVTQYEAKACEAAGLIKYDFLVIHQLSDIRVAMQLINKKVGVKHRIDTFDHQGTPLNIWDLPELQEVYQSTWGGSTETCFQINTASMIPHLKNMLPTNMMDLATLLALVRPGPLDFINPDTGRNMVEEYMLLRKGEVEPDMPALTELLPETFGVIAFQEQLGKIARDLAGFPGPEAETLRANMAKKRMEKLEAMKPAFMEGASKKLDLATATAIWDRMVTFGRYGFSVIHAVEYAHVTYACMFLKHFYPLEWWAAVLTNAEEKEITGKLWPFVKDLVTSPDINLSSDEMVIDYANNKIRAKFGIIRGIGDKSVEPIVAGRPYKDIQDYVNKEVAGPSLSMKLIHVGVLDSLFPAKTSLVEKIQAYVDAVEYHAFDKKQAKAAAEGKTTRAKAPSKGVVPAEYIDIHPVRDAQMRKSVLPSLALSTYALGAAHSKVLSPFLSRPKVKNTRGQESMLINGEYLQRLNEMDGINVEKDIYVAATVFIAKTEPFAYGPGKSKRALKMIVDCDGYVSEQVLWPGYDSGVLEYPPELQKGSIATIFFRKRAGKKDMAIQEIVVEA